VKTHRVAHGLRFKVCEDLEGERAVLLSAVSANAFPGRPGGRRLHMRERLGDDVTGRIGYLGPDVMPCPGRGGQGLDQDAVSGDDAAQVAGQPDVG
jgi:hypothetical protein